MIDLDFIKSLYFIYPVINGFIIIFFALYALLYRVKTPLIFVFFFGRLCVILALLLMLLRSEISFFLSIPIANTFLIFGLFNEIYAVFSIDKPFKPSEYLKINSIPLFLVVIYMFFTASPSNIRISSSSIILGIIYFIGGVILVTNKSKTKIQFLSGFLLIIAALLYFFRSFRATLDENYSIFNKNDFELFFYLYLFFLGFYLAILLLLILYEKDQEKKKKDNLALQKINHSKNKLFSIIAHDLRGPIGGLQQVGELLWKNEESNHLELEKKKKFTENIYKTSKKTFNLLDNLLKWASSNSGNIEVNPIKINLKNLIAENIGFFKTDVHLKNIELNHNLEDNLVVFADYNMINTVIRNLISNAIKFTNYSGKIEIIAFNNENQDNCITIIIKDNGVGMSEEEATQVLKIESSISTLGTDNEIGTGFGLKLCNEFVLKNNGEIWIKSKINKGTSIFINLPKNNEE